MEVIQAKVDSRLLSKADRLFTGTVDGRIIEILQNARRAGATEVHIINRDGQVTVRDNGWGIADFSALLDLGKSGWDERMESAEDPAGVGVFCLAPREVCITSGGRKVVIGGKGWTGEPVEVQAAEPPVAGTTLAFGDTAWLFEMVEKHAVFTGLKVTVDGKECAREPFVSDNAAPHPELGCRIEVREWTALGRWHGEWKHRYYSENVLVTLAAKKELEATDIWYHLGGWSEEGDTYDTQLEAFQEQLRLFWATVMGPGEYMRQRLLDCIRDFNIRWKQITVESSGKVWISYKDGSAQMLRPPELSAGQ